MRESACILLCAILRVPAGPCANALQLFCPDNPKNQTKRGAAHVMLSSDLLCDENKAWGCNRMAPGSGGKHGLPELTSLVRVDKALLVAGHVLEIP